MRDYVHSSIVLIAFIAVDATAVPAGADSNRFDSYILRSINEVMRTRENAGYGGYYTRGLMYGPYQGTPGNPPIKASDKAPKTVCVAAVAETIIEALNLYYSPGTAAAAQPFQSLPPTSWDVEAAPLKNLSHYIMMHGICTCEGKQLVKARGKDDAKCNTDMLEALGQSEQGNKNYYMKSRYIRDASSGTGHALWLFGIGEKSDFPHVRPGEFLNFDRTKGLPGHAVVFLNYISKSKGVTPDFTSPADIIGFHYYSSQGTTNGLKEKAAYFDGKCPTPQPADSECNVDEDSLVAGFMLNPAKWDLAEGQNRLDAYLREKSLLGCAVPPGELIRKQENDFIYALREFRSDREHGFSAFSSQHPNVMEWKGVTAETLSDSVANELNTPMTLQISRRLEAAE